ncbi:MAG TPA: histone-like nucleoid-structuring protein Lsr2 [Streptosporangiaceae bacterium]|jgi:hypothetical protein|nr:histone-like nucleoid-structuring protein Lsr2 [Streptosporangiaceae bacterium]
MAVTEVEMATRTAITLEDDINGGPAQETLQFRLGIAEYEIDLNARNEVRQILSCANPALLRVGAWAQLPIPPPTQHGFQPITHRYRLTPVDWAARARNRQATSTAT